MSLKTKPKPLLARPESRKRVATRGDASFLSLENGDRLTASEFLRRYETAADLKKAQLIEGIVHMPSPVRAEAHSEPDGLLHGWLFSYALEHLELRFYPNATLILDSDNAPQPDAILCSTPVPGGRVWLNEKDYLCGGLLPES